MLKKILQDMFIDPELLSELDEEQKQLLFCKMREEQIRRWKEKETTKNETEKRSPIKFTKAKRLKGKVKVDFVNGADGKPWTWVMGEHPSDKSVEEILELEAQKKANTLAKLETEELRKMQNLNLCETGDAGKKEYVREIKFIHPTTATATSLQKPQILRPKPVLKLNRDDDVSETTNLDKLELRRSNEIYLSLKQERDKSKQNILEENKQIEKAWQEQEKASKKIDEEKRSMTQHVRQVWSNSLSRIRTESQVIDGLESTSQTSSASIQTSRSGSNYKNLGKDRPAMPVSKAAVIKWFKDVEEMKGAARDPKTKSVAAWFHGIISREETEELLRSKPAGSFLIRVSDKIWGYAISYKTETRCKHFLIDAGDAGYQFFGLYHVVHSSLADLVEFHKENPLSSTGREILRYPVGQSKSIPDYDGLFMGIPEDDSEDSYL